jgi:anion-transporting  ArsA/GET3 family ATPase
MSPMPPVPVLDVDALLADPATRILLCCGSGGVGKTTTAAALALRAAEQGRSVVVLTIDPARRLAQSMGLTELDNIPRPVAGIDDAAGGRLEAMMLDMKRTFDELVEAHAEPDRVEQILANPFYQSLSSSLAGTQEYMAMEKLGQLSEEAARDGRWDLIVVDTPPSRSALDFLDAPSRLGSFLDGRFVRVLAAPARGAGRGIGRVLSTGFSIAANVLQRVLGAQLLTEVAMFVAALDSIFGGFRQRAERTYALLQQPGTEFLVIAAPERDALREAAYFVDRLRADAMPLAGVVLNRMVVPRTEAVSAEQAVAAAERLLRADPVAPVEAATAGVLQLHAERVRTALRQRHLTERFTAAHEEVPVAFVPALADDVHDLEGLREIGELLGTR